MFADYIKLKKEEFHWTTDELALQSGVPTGTINKILNGETKSPRYDTMKAIEEAFSQAEQRMNLFNEANAADGYGMEGDHYTIKDYYAFPDSVRIELIDGKIYYMASPTSDHQMVLTDLIVSTANFIKEKGGACTPIVSPMDVQLDCDDKTMVQPDFIIVCDKNKIKKNCIFGAPDFVVEVLSPSSRFRDGNLKLRKYITAGVKEYWIIDLERRRVISYFMEDDYIPFIYAMEDPVPVKIYEEQLKIKF